MENVLYFGDNLDIMRRYVPDEVVDLVYADPPFKSDQNYNVLFAEKDGSQAASQIRAFDDTWSWDSEDEAVFADLVTAGGKVADAVQAFRQLIGPCDMLSYLVMMAPRLLECRRVLKATGSMYLHCDPAASHYLKLLMDAVFGPGNFLNAIPWKRTYAHGSAKRYPTQKPVALLDRIIRSSCPEGGAVLDPLCGCGTTITAAQTLGRTWIGIDITHLAITLMKERLFSVRTSSVSEQVGVRAGTLQPE